MGDELVSIMESKSDGRAKEFAKLFTAYFNATVSVSRNMFNIAQQPQKSDYMRAGMDAMLDVLELSGLALLFSELDDTTFGRITVGIWSNYFKSAAVRKEMLLAWIGPLGLRLTLPIYSSSGAQRFAWESRLVPACESRSRY